MGKNQLLRAIFNSYVSSPAKVCLIQVAVHLHFFQQLQGRWVLLAAAAAPHGAEVGADLRHLALVLVLQELL